MGKLISIIVPCYNEQETVERFYEEIIKVTNEINGYEFEFVYVNDGSKDQTEDAGAGGRGLQRV